MIGKVLSGRSFGGCVRYVMLKEGASVLLADGVREEMPRHAVQDFNLQRKMRPGLGEAVGHISLNWSVVDKPNLDNERMIGLAKEYLGRMKICNTQVLIVKHNDRDHPHIHIVYNRVANDGRTISDKYLKKRNVEICKLMTMKHGLFMAEGKKQVNRSRLIGSDHIRYQIYDVLKQQLKKCADFDDLKTALASAGIKINYKSLAGTNQVQGISFEKDGCSFKGSAIDRSMAFAKIAGQLEENKRAEKLKQIDQSKTNLGLGI
ncbi:MAG: relaxase/mobilization nuclease domain-containing protein [Pedobacter sp.]|jgi:hypothetical protein|uniref:relaxase/mobilization nuclease domain-containing protein n=1 Tax=Pedobacter sp. TaxID=1411316 RepID=UPI0035635906